MQYKDFEIALKNKAMSLDNTYWIVDYRFDDINNKPIRHVTPTEVAVFNVADTPPPKRVYYADYYFKPLGATGKPLAKVIAPYDNTGYRGYTGISVQVFETEKEAKDFYRSQCQIIIDQIEVAQHEMNRRFAIMQKEVIESMLSNN